MPRHYLFLVLSAGLLALLASAWPDAAATPQPQDPPLWSDLRGRVIFQGDPPRSDRVLPAFPTDACCRRHGPLAHEDFVLNPENRGVQWALVWLEPDPNAGPQQLPVHPSLKEIKQPDVVIRQSGCRYVPHVAVLRQGQRLVVNNRDDAPHTVWWTGDPNVNPGGAVNLPPTRRHTVTGLKAQRIPIFLRCMIHPWMGAWVKVIDHPYAAVTDADGRFEIKLAPVGRWRLRVWQESHGWRGQVAGKDGEPVHVHARPVTDLGTLALDP
jgi:hypothetical protein